jgi:hypothetical protein
MLPQHYIVALYPLQVFPLESNRGCLQFAKYGLCKLQITKLQIVSLVAAYFCG